ncbi:hypothetical protein [Longispora albida]|uniref:hypothetical protein n=1 Tax=Longispora albida TaxID=203523 RepID=UPI0003696C56|nr:hypothetical protein [Longispora albida]
MTKLRRSLAVTAAGLLGAGALLSLASPASASGTYVPGCIDRNVQSSWVTLKNNCGYDMRMQVHIGAYPDTSCFTVKAGKSETVFWGGAGYYQHTVKC